MSLIHTLTQELQTRYGYINQFSWQKNARPEQLLPKGDWSTWLILAGRGFGKTRTGAEAVRFLVQTNKIRHIGLIAETDLEGRHVLIEGVSGLMAVHPLNERPLYSPSNHKLFWKNGATATLYSAERPDHLRGAQFDFVWIDELAKFKYGQNIWDQIQFCLRLGPKPQAIITTTPRSMPLIKSLLQLPTTHVTRGSTWHNKKNLPLSFLENIKTLYGQTDLGQQEIEGKIIDHQGPTLWDESLFQPMILKPSFVKVVVAVDPAVSQTKTSSETGIIVAGIDADNRGYILADYSGKYSPQEWAAKALSAYDHYGAIKIIVENNQGGDLVSTLLHALNPRVSIHTVRAVHSKNIRAQPIAFLYQQKKIFHAPHLHRLENQLVGFGHHKKSPDRVDALVWALTYLFYDKKSPLSPKIWSY